MAQRKWSEDRFTLAWMLIVMIGGKSGWHVNRLIVGTNLKFNLNPIIGKFQKVDNIKYFANITKIKFDT